MAYDDVHEVVEQIFESLLSRYQVGLKTLMRGSHFIFDDINFLCYECHKINFKGGG